MAGEQHKPLVAAGFAVAAMACFAGNDTAVKLLSGGYPLYELIFIRTLVGMPVLLVFVVPMSGGLAALRTQALGLQLVRGGLVVITNMLFFMSLPLLPLAEASALFFVAPLILTFLAAIVLKERVGKYRIGASLLGLIGVIVMVRPSGGGLHMAALLPLGSAFSYAAMQLLTRKLGAHDSAVALAFYIQLTFLCVSSTAGLVFGAGQFSGGDNASLQFLFRPWIMPNAGDVLTLVVLGFCASLGGLFISHAYRSAEAAMVAPFEYSELVLAVSFGWLFFGELPDFGGFIGIGLIISAGLVVVWRETRLGRQQQAA